eukprot:6207424-Pleurochrysis_carterae.AAC.7
MNGVLHIRCSEQLASMSRPHVWRLSARCLLCCAGVRTASSTPSSTHSSLETRRYDADQSFRSANALSHSLPKAARGRTLA